MRPGLVAVGVAFAVLGAAVFVAVIDPSDEPTITRSSYVGVDSLPAGSWRTFNISATSAASSRISISWNSSGDVVVSWYATVACDSPAHWCRASTAIDSWSPPTLAGHWSGSGSTGPLYILYVSTAPTSSVNFTASFSEQYRSADPSLPFVPFAVVLAGGSVLAGIGGVLIYLGLFLPAGTFEPSGSEWESDEPESAAPEAPGPQQGAPPAGRP